MRYDINNKPLHVEEGWLQWCKDNLTLRSKASISRYDNLRYLIKKYKPKTICEIGTAHGKSSCIMIEEALKHQDKVHFTGYDLFEDQTIQDNIREFNGKGVRNPDIEKLKITNPKKLNRKVPSVKDVTNRIKKVKVPDGKKLEIELIRGNTNDTLKENSSWDLIFIDGGHSKETVINDYQKTKNSKVVVFDDFIVVFDTEDNRMSQERKTKFLAERLKIDSESVNKLIEENKGSDFEMHGKYGAHFALEENSNHKFCPNWFTKLHKAIFQVYIVNEK